ncbi:Pre-pilin like leader sequence protein [Salinisphaera shabanensis E1L3A]|uniref:Type II secretion system protein H n=1 Tax=Salinisphaera shabanensis E1L3A TaxID=1033802 RepID=U2FNY6_9GAMM|nr:GspH/FimT family pseudopilin [Salinisphaera shabanensis]ERJ17889.1 Pre-pilin like leader sequence protein [Salinisphaera shabanensis E1L3A]
MGIPYSSTRHSNRGFTLLELIVAMAVAAILLAIAIPSYRSVIQRNSMAATVNDLVGDLNFARSQAVTRGRQVYVCRSNGNNSCDGDGDWSDGWIIYAPDPGSESPNDDNVLRVHGAMTNQISIVGNNNITSRVFFDPNGFAMGSIGTFTATAHDSAQQTLVVIASTGRIRTETVQGSSGT